MNKSILPKYVADRALASCGVSQDDLQCDSDGKVLYGKTFSSVIYKSHEKGEPMQVIVTVDIALRDMLFDFSLVYYDFTEEVELEHFRWTTGEIDELVVKSEYILPVYVMVVFDVETMAPGMEWYGDLRAQCKYAREIWESQLHMVYPGVTTFTDVTPLQAYDLWEHVRTLDSLSLLHAVAEWAMEGEDRHSYYIPNLYPSNFGIYNQEFVPYNAVMSLPIYGIQCGEVISQNRKY